MKFFIYYLGIAFLSMAPVFAVELNESEQKAYSAICDRTRPESSSSDHMQVRFNFSVQEFFDKNACAVRSFTPDSFKPYTMQTLYGPVVVDDPLIAQLIESAPMQRLKAVHQYGITYFIDDTKWFSRYEHSVGVWALLKMYGASREEQIAGLLHDVSHTVFSHVGDWFFKKNYVKESHQDEKHEWYLENTHIPEILKQYNLTIEQIKHKENGFLLLEQPRPDLCVDRIEYNLRGGLIEGMIEKHEIQAILDNLQYKDGKWFFTSVELAKTFSMIALYHSEHVWGGPLNHMIYQWAAHALHRAVEIDLLSIDDIYFSTDSIVWQKLVASHDAEIKESIKKLKRHKTIVRAATGEVFDVKIKTKFSGVDPLVKVGHNFKRLTEVDQSYKFEYDRVKKQVSDGWPIVFLHELKEANEQILQIIK